ncbi:MAG: TonB-dependent receptor [Bacteroidota bacterium]
MKSYFMKSLYLFLTSVIIHSVVFAQNKQDTVSARSLDSVTVTGYLRPVNLLPLPPVQGTYIFSGKRSEQVNLLQTDANFADKVGRQVFAKLPGVFVYDMDGAGNQINIAARGLDPHRGWEFNIRKDGIITNSDMYGYPASHYSMPLESIDHVELVRGTGSLQYGSQFGGMLNYVSKTGDTTRPFSFESINTGGSFKLLSSYNAVSGKLGKFRYYAYLYRKSRAGYRDNEHTDSEAENVAITYEPNQKFSVKLEWARSTYLYRIPGALNDSMFHADPRQATRSRNYFSPDIHVPSVNLQWQIAPQTRLQFTSSAVLGRRNSVMFDKPTNVADTINKATFQYNNRQVDIDRFNSYTSELRILQQYAIAGKNSFLAAGIQYMNNDLHRTQLGKGTTGSDYDLTLVEPGWGRDMHFKTQNVALFAENSFRLLHNLSINAGARVEMGHTDMSGTISYYPDNEIPLTLKHHFPLFGASFSYRPEDNLEVYGGWSQAYRCMAFKDLIPASLYEKVDPGIKDAKGYNLELGTRGNWNFLRWDITGFLLQYDNRFGTLSQTDDNGNFILYRTNIGNSLTKGLEIFIQANWMLGNRASLSFFTSTALMDARYTGNASVKSGNANVSVRGNRVESAPPVITRNGVTFKIWKVSLSGLYSYTGKTYADALNTIIPPAATGATGLVPAYGILDINSSVRLTRNLDFRLNINNVTNKQYFTKRPTFYPGPGVWPSEGRSVNISFGIRL